MCSEAVHKSSVCHLNISTGTIQKESNICLICYASTGASHSRCAYYNSLYSLNVLVLQLDQVLAEQSSKKIKYEKNIDLLSEEMKCLHHCSTELIWGNKNIPGTPWQQIHIHCINAMFIQQPPWGKIDWLR